MRNPAFPGAPGLANCPVRGAVFRSNILLTKQLKVGSTLAHPGPDTRSSTSSQSMVRRSVGMLVFAAICGALVAPSLVAAQTLTLKEREGLDAWYRRTADRTG